MWLSNLRLMVLIMWSLLHTSDVMKCYQCGKEGHIQGACTEKVNDAEIVDVSIVVRG